MRCYRLNGEDNKFDIIDVIENDDRTLKVSFADGTSFDHVVKTPETIEKINCRLEEQLSDGLNNLPKFKAKLIRRRIAGLAYGLSGVAAIATSICLADNPAVPLCISASLLVGGSCLGYNAKLVSDTVKELEKLDYRNQHRNLLRKTSQYRMELLDLPINEYDRIQAAESEGIDPFGNICADEFSKKDLEMTVNILEKAEMFNFPRTEISASTEKGTQYTKKSNAKR